MPEPLRTVAFVLAGGVGSRLGLDVPKQLVEIGGRTILGHAIAAFDAHPAVDEVVVLMAAGHLAAAEAVVRDGGFTKVTRVVEGGATRSATTARALEELDGRECNVLLHDAARPLVSARIITDCIQALADHRALTVAIHSSDTIVEVTAQDTVGAVPPRATLRRVQTPQGFRSSVITEAYDRALRDPDFTVTDDASVVLRYLPEVAVHVVRGDERNIKVTEPVDVVVAEALLTQARSTQPSG